MALNQFLCLAALTSCGLAYACSSNAGNTSEGSSGTAGTAAIDSQHDGGSPAIDSIGKSQGLAGKPRDSELAGSGGSSGEDDTRAEAGSAGWGMDALPPSPANAVPSVDQAHTECDLNGGCVSKCTDQTVTCSVQSLGFACEMEGFVGASVPVACGQRVVVGTACCGMCGCVPVEVFFDGTSCWQGMPQCNVPAFNNEFFDPHAPGSADATSNPLPGTVPGSFFLGAAGADFGVPPTPAGSGGDSAGGSGGTPALSSAGNDTSGGGGGNAGASAVGGGGAAGTSGVVQTSAGGDQPSQP